MFCYNCGNELSDKAIVCPNCKVNKNKNSISPKQLMLSAIIPIFGIIVGLINIKVKYGKIIILLAIASNVIYTFLGIGLINFLEEDIFEIIDFPL